ncbi:hypothetical protein BD310DRAFT_940006 [Dichomitus squalens]|uniref:Uncharacterized protein n=1 Tax=Dichomitus squalens TaxID=114155 RepID=A0A4Q9PEK6_9APHY|nr:hypothetical protein BD310DRAFT_940006 [Dichomitus squalens]
MMVHYGVPGLGDSSPWDVAHPTWSMSCTHYSPPQRFEKNTRHSNGTRTARLRLRFLVGSLLWFLGCVLVGVRELESQVITSPPSHQSSHCLRNSITMASAVFSKLKSVTTKPLGRISVLATETRAKVGPHLPRGSTVVSGIKVSFAVATTLGLSVPYMQGISDAASKVKEHADAMKSNRKECKRIAALADDLASGLLAITNDVKEEDLDDITRLNLAEFEWILQRIGGAMALIGKESFVRRLLAKDEHAERLADHRQTLQDAMSKFQVMLLTRALPGLTRIEKKQDSVLWAVGASPWAEGR